MFSIQRKLSASPLPTKKSIMIHSGVETPPVGNHRLVLIYEYLQVTDLICSLIYLRRIIIEVSMKWAHKKLFLCNMWLAITFLLVKSWYSHTICFDYSRFLSLIRNSVQPNVVVKKNFTSDKLLLRKVDSSQQHWVCVDHE